MLLDDSIELDCDDSSTSPEPLPVNWDIDLSKIWIPSSVLPNRKKQINQNENKPFVLYTLEKPDYSKTFPIYNDECPQYHESQTLSIVSSIPQPKLINDKKNKDGTQQALPSSQNAVEEDTRLVIGNENGIFPTCPVNNNKLDDSLRDEQETYNSMIRNTAQWERKASDTYSVQETSYRASLEDLTRRMAEILSEDEPLKENWYHEDIIKTNQVTTGSTLDSITPSTKDSLEELYYSEEDENQFAVEYELDNLEIESPEKRPSCSIYTENSYVQEQPFESFVNSLEQAKNDSDKTINQSFEKTEKIQIENQKEAVDKVFNRNEHGELRGIEIVSHTKDSEQELLNYEEKLEDPTEKVPEFPIAYKRPPLQEQTNKTKLQKKKTKKTKINIPLEDLFQKEEGDRFKVPEIDEFYENLVRQGKCPPRNQEMNVNGFLSVNLTEDMQTNVCKSLSISEQDQSHKLFWDSAQKFRESLNSESQSNSPDEVIRNEKAEPERNEKAETEAELNCTLVIENIPLNVSKEDIESVIVGFGELKKLTIKRHRKFQRAQLQIDPMSEMDWIIDCLNDTQPFGSYEGKIKCYRQT